jgi:hypothetical protein
MVRIIGIALLLGITVPGAAWAADPEPEPLRLILVDGGLWTKANVTTAATARARTGAVEEKSNKQETRVFKGWFLSARDNTSLAALSDDGVDVIVKPIGGQADTVLGQFGQPQHLPNTDKSLHFLEPPALSLVEAGIYEVTVRYSNTIFTGPTDRDGVSLFAYGGGGREFSICLMGRNVSGAITEFEDRFVLDADSLTTRNVQFKIDKPTALTGASQAALGNTLRWTLSQIVGIDNDHRYPDPAWEAGSEMAKGIGPSRIYVTQLPPTNEGWGEKTLTLEVIENGQTALSLTESPRLFFDRTDRSHPEPEGGDTGNWHYYWSLEGDPAVCAFSRDSENANYVRWCATVPNHPTAYGIWSPSDELIAISDVAAKKESWQYSFPENGTHEDWIHFSINVTNSPDFVNVVFAHEATHRICDGTGLGTDTDNDGVPDAWEERIPGMNPNSQDSFGGAFTVSEASDATRDEEFYAVLSGAVKKGTNAATAFSTITKNPPTGNYEGGMCYDADETKDWSKDGVNWKKDD